jgi:YidC/Oxa1 family membrane protein insertase
MIVVPVQFISMKLPQMLAKKRSRNSVAISSAGSKQMKKTKMIQLIFTIVMCAVVIFSATGVAIYWFLSACFTMAQTAILHTIIMKNKKKNGTLENKLDKIFNV